MRVLRVFSVGIMSTAGPDLPSKAASTNYHTKKAMEILMLPVKIMIGGAGELWEGLTVHCPGPLQRSGLQCPATGHPEPGPSTGSRVYHQTHSGRLPGTWKPPVRA